MNFKTHAPAALINAILWAGMMLAAAWLFRGVDNSVSQTFLFLQIAGWIVTQGLITSAGRQSEEPR